MLILRHDNFHLKITFGWSSGDANGQILSQMWSLGTIIRYSTETIIIPPNMTYTEFSNKINKAILDKCTLEALQKMKAVTFSELGRNLTQMAWGGGRAGVANEQNKNLGLLTPLLKAIQNRKRTTTRWGRHRNKRTWREKPWEIFGALLLPHLFVDFGAGAESAIASFVMQDSGQVFFVLVW